jgi:O-acetyl-ADP-ribose deacetylase (regulator of RNase III)
MPQGSVVEAPACGSHYKTVFHAVGVNGFYESSEQIIQNLLQQVFTRCKEMGLSSVAVPAIGTGYGNLEIQEFYNAFKASLVHANGFNVTLCLQNMDGLDSSCV